MEKFIGIQMLMSIVSLPSYELYWSKELQVDCVANVMSLKCYKLIRHYLHANDNTEKNENSSRLFKVEPVVNTLSTNCLSVEQEQYQSIDRWSQQKPKEVASISTCQRKSTSADSKTLSPQVPLESYMISFSTQDKKVLVERNVDCLR